MKKIAIIGHFGNNKELYNGQTIKTKSIHSYLVKEFGEENVVTYDTSGIKNIIKTVLMIPKVVKETKNVLILPAQRGVKVIAPIISFWNKKYKNKTHYIVIGGWLKQYVEKSKLLKKSLMQFSHIYLELQCMKKDMEELGFNNVEILYNSKQLRIINSKDFVEQKKPYKLCTFSRVLKEKGIEDAIEVVNRINKDFSETVCCLDIYGQIDEKYKERFTEIMRTFPDYIRYRGIVDPLRSVEVIKDYYLLLFPTLFIKSEGIPGTIIDAMAAGVPVVSSRWIGFVDMFVEKENGVGFEAGNLDDFYQTLLYMIENPEIVKAMKYNCIYKAADYLPENAFALLKDNII